MRPRHAGPGSDAHHDAGPFPAERGHHQRIEMRDQADLRKQRERGAGRECQEGEIAPQQRARQRPRPR
jgi:hypothetical protein